MNSLPGSKFDFDSEDAFSEEEYSNLDALSEDDLDIDLDGFDFDDIDLEDLESWEEEAEAEEAAQDVPPISPVQARPLTAESVSEETSEPEATAQPGAQQDMDDDFSAEIRGLLSDDDTDDQDDPFAEEPSDAQLQETLEDDALPPLIETLNAPEPDEAPEMPAAGYDAALEPSAADDEEFEPRDGDHIPVPRINIDVFCETTKISTLVEATANDRRMSKAHVNLSLGGVEKAVQHYQEAATPNLIIIETAGNGDALFEGLGRLAEVCDPSTKVIVIGAVNDISFYRELMSRGISDYLINPRAPIQLTRSIAALYLDPTADPIGKNLVFVGTRGGTGSSTICHNVAWSISEHHANDAVLLDLDLPFGTASLDFAQDPSHGLTEALGAPERLDDVLLDRLLQKCTERLSLFSAPNMLDQHYDLPASSFEEVLDIVRKSAPNIIIDLPHGWNDWTRNVLQSADQIVITATPDLSSYRNAKNLIEAINAARANDAPPLLVMNQVGVPKRPEVPVEQFAEALGIDPVAVIPWEPVLFGSAATNAETVFQTDGKSKVAGCLDEIAGVLLGRHERKSKSKGFSIKSLLKF